MIEKIVVPTLGESITEATVAKWLKNEGDSVKVDEAIVELETDKVNVEVPSPINGVLSEINSKDGAVVEVGALLGSISQTENSSTNKEKEQVIKVKPDKKENNVVNLVPERKIPKIFDEKTTTEPPLKLNDEPLVLTKEVKEKNSDLIKQKNENLSPAVRKIVDENKIDLANVSGSGKEGRILKGDLIGLMGINQNHQKEKINMVKRKELK